MYFGTGADGALVVHDAQHLKINLFAPVLQTTPKGSANLKVNPIDIFAQEKEVYIIQMKGDNAGQSMFARVTSVDSRKSSITISSGLTFTCSSSGINRCQVVTVPHYTNVTLKSRAVISAAPWNGYTGGIIVLRSQGKVLRHCHSYTA